MAACTFSWPLRPPLLWDPPLRSPPSWTLVTASWCYDPQKPHSPNCTAPGSWGTGFNKNCAGKKQSPIDIITHNTQFGEKLTLFTFVDYDAAHDVKIKNNGHSVEVKLEDSLRISEGGLSETYKAVQFHLHWGKGGNGGSEHTINSERFPMELHIVHIREDFDSTATAAGETTGIAVLGFLFKEGPVENKNYKPLIDALKRIQQKGNSTTIPGLKLQNLIPQKADLNCYYRYEGSLTTPDCNEAVVWTVFEEKILLSKAQLQAFYQDLYYPDGSTKMSDNFRPVQSLNSRVVYRSSASISTAQGATFFIAVKFAYLMAGLQH